MKNDLGTVSIFADDDIQGNVILKVGDGLKLSVHWKVANGVIPMVYAACRAAEENEKKSKRVWLAEQLLPGLNLMFGDQA